MWVLNWRGEKKKRKGDANPHRKHLWCTKASSSCSCALYFTFSRLTYKRNEHLVVFFSVLIQLCCKFLPHKEASRSILRFSFLFPCDVYTWAFLLPTPQNSLAVMNAPSTPPWPAPHQIWEEDRQSPDRGLSGSCVQHGSPFLSERPSRLTPALLTVSCPWPFTCREKALIAQKQPPTASEWSSVVERNLLCQVLFLGPLLFCFFKNWEGRICFISLYPQIGRNAFCNLLSSSGYCVNEHWLPFLQDLLLCAEQQILTFAVSGQCISVILLLVT